MPSYHHCYRGADFWSIQVYITGSAFTILGDADTILQTVYDDDPSHLQAVAFDESSGKVATCTESVIRVYKPFGQTENALKWGLQSSYPVPDHQNAAKGVSLSWGGNEELLVAHSALYLYSTANEPEQLWNKPLPNSVKLAEISYDSAYIACVGAHDCLVKVWRRLTYGAEDVRFDLAYLRHPDLVTSLRWRKPLHTDQTVENVLFTTCADNIVRVWTGTDTHAFRHMNLWGSVDLASSFRDPSLGSTTPTAPLVTFVIDGREVSAATELALQRCSVKEEPRDTALESLISLANNSAELCVASDATGNMMVFAFEDVGSKTRKSQAAIKVTSFRSHALDFRSDHQGADGHANGQEETSISEFCRFKLKDAEGIAYMLPVDPAGSTPATSGFLDVFARDIAVSYTHAGRVDFWTARVGNTGKSVGWLSTSSAETGLVEPALVSGSTLKKAAIVDSARCQLFIWDIGGARLEFTQDYGRHNTIQDLDWTSTPDSQSILAVGFQSKVVLLCQMRFDYLNKGPAWAAVREISIREFTPHPIGDSTWLGDGHLVIGSGNQMLVHGREYDLSGSLINSLQLPHRKNGVWDLFDAVQRFNGPLPVFHPQFLSQCILAGKSTIVRTIVMALHRTLKFLIAGETVDDYLGLEPAVFYSSGASPMQASGSQVGSHFNLQVSADETDELEEPFSEETALAINERLTKVGLQQLSGHEQIQLADIVECVGLVEKQRRSLDENGARFMLFFRQHGLRKGRTSEIQMSWREINWAYHSTSQDILTDFVSKQCHGALRWEDARESGMFMWLTDRNALLAQFEIVARNEYTKSEMKNPVDCSIYYLALKKKTVLQGLWRMAHWNREQKATQKLLSNNFEDPKWRTTALKNAYALLSKRRFEYATAFFLLADHLQDAVNVCLNQLKDLQLAVAIARVYEGDQGLVLKRLLEEEVLAVAAKEGNRWLASWAFWMLNRKDMAVRALIVSLATWLSNNLRFSTST
ncbi:regulator of (H+)-ATPase in vacuolar membrane [Colletotrichum sp. CLE4]